MEEERIEMTARDRERMSVLPGAAALRLLKGAGFDVTPLAGGPPANYGGNGALFMPDLNLLLRPPYVFVMLGILSISAAAVFTSTGKAWVRLNGWVYRAKEPGWFWWEGALYYLGDVWFVRYFLYKVYGL